MTYIPELSAYVDTNNQSTTPLAGAGVYTGTGTDVTLYGSVTVTAYADQSGTLEIQFSSDNSNWDLSQTANLTAATGVVSMSTNVLGQYYRVVYTNGSTAQSTFRLQSLVKTISENSTAVALTGGSVPEGGGTVTSIVNSSTTALTAGNSFTGTAELNGNSRAAIYLYVNTATSPAPEPLATLQVQLSTDANNWDHSVTWYVLANVGQQHVVEKGTMYFRVIVTNISAANMNALRLTTMYGNFGPPGGSTNASFSLSETAQTTRTIDTEFLIGSGLMTGVVKFNKFGRHTDIDTADVPADVWDGGATVSNLYAGWATGAETVTIISTSANDTAAGSGARKVTLVGLDANWDQQTEEVTLNGTTGAASTNTFIRVNRAYVSEGGTPPVGAANAGVLTVRQTTTTSVVFSVIAAGIGQSQIAVLSVPRNYTAFLVAADVSVVAATSANEIVGGFWLRNTINGATRIIQTFGVGSASSYSRRFYGGARIEEYTDISVRVTAVGNNNADVIAAFDLVMLADPS